MYKIGPVNVSVSALMSEAFDVKIGREMYLDNTSDEFEGQGQGVSG